MPLEIKIKIKIKIKVKKKNERKIEYSEIFSICDPIHEEYFMVQQLGRIKENWQQLLYSQILSIIKNAK